MTMMSKENLSSPPRERVSVGITGIDRSTPDDLVKDGKCEELHNARYEAEAWRPVHPYMLSKSVPNLPITHKIVYKHPAAPENIYIVESFVNGKYNYEAYDTTKMVSEEGAITPLVSRSEVQMTISHFGNVLMFTGNETVYFILHNDNYVKWTRPSYARTQEASMRYVEQKPTMVRVMMTTDNEDDDTWIPYDEYSKGGHGNINAAWYGLYNISQNTPLISSDDLTAWHGELMLFTTYVMADGTNISPSPLHLVKSNTAATLSEDIARNIGISYEPTWIFRKTVTRDDNDTTQDSFLGISIYSKERTGLSASEYTEPSLKSCVPSIKISHSLTDDQKTLIRSIAVWVTRVNPVYRYSTSELTTSGGNRRYGLFDDYSHSTEPNENVGGGWRTSERSKSASSDNYRQGSTSGITSSNGFVDYYAENNLPNQPFYLYKEIPLDDFEDNALTISLTKDSLNNVITNRTYTPQNNIHDILYGIVYDYNARAHFANLTTTLYEGYTFNDIRLSGDAFGQATTEIVIDNKHYESSVGFLYNALGGKAENVPFSRILSYPDYRATTIDTKPWGAYPLKEAINNNYAWTHEPHTEAEKFPLIKYEMQSHIFPILKNGNNIVYTPNKIQVSSANNIFSLSFENNYNIGGDNNRIIAMQSAAIEMPEMKVGEMPLYVFTTEGIFALIAGQNTLYASVAAINYDKIINPNTLAINGAIVYITEKGVHLLTTQGTQVISTPINDKANRPPLDFLRSCKLIYPKERNEIILHNEIIGKGVAYIYNLDAGYWSTRDLEGYKLNTDELYTVNNNIYDLANEDENISLPMSFVTRPMKLGNVEFKRLETIIPRLATGEYPIEFKMSVEGSVDGSTYMPMRSANIDFEANRVNPITLRRTPFSAKYIKMMFDISPADKNHNPSFSHIDIEWYRKLPHRMR